MAIQIGQRYTRASDNTQQEQNVSVSIDSVRVDKEDQIAEVPILKGVAGQRQYFKEITGLVRDLLEGTPKALSHRIPYAILEEEPQAFPSLQAYIPLYYPTDLDALQVEEGDFLLVIRDFSVDPTVDVDSFRFYFVHEIVNQPPPLPYLVNVQIPVPGSPPTFTLNDTAFPLGSIVINLSKFKPDSCLGDEGQLGLKTQLEQPSVPSFADVSGGIGEVIFTIQPVEDEVVMFYDIWVRSEKPTALTPDMIPDATIAAADAAIPSVATTFNGGDEAGGFALSTAPGDYWVTITARARRGGPLGAYVYMDKYNWTPSDPAEPVMVTTS